MVCESQPGDTGFRRHRRAAEAWVEGGRAGVPKERPGEAISVGAAWAAVKDPGLKSGEKLSLVIM